MIEKEVLKILENDARLSPEQIASMTGSTAENVECIIKQAEQEGTILRYKALIDWDKAGNDHVFALIEVRITPQREVGFNSIAERIYKFDEARSVYLMSGTFDLLVLVAGRTLRDISDFVTGKLAPIEGVTGTASHFLLKRYKEDGVIISGKEEPRRQAVIL